MLEAGMDQGAGLRRWMVPQQTLQLIAMARHGDAETELPLLWQLCSALHGSGQTVAVLDGSSAETESSPGLQHWLDGSHWPGDAPAQGPAWPVFPSAVGLAGLQHGRIARAQALHLLGALLKDYGVVLAYAPAPALAALLAGSQATPLVAVSPAATTVLTGYAALKTLLGAGLKPALAAQGTLPGPSTDAALASVRRTLQQCARTYLGEQLGVLTIHVAAHDDRPSADLQRLAGHLLENAMPICQDAQAPL